MARRVASVIVAGAWSLAACTHTVPPSDATDEPIDATPAMDAPALDHETAMDAPADLPVLPPPDPCDANALTDPRTFPPCGRGAGVFGRWIVDRYGLPAYDYLAAQDLDPRAAYPTTVGTDTRDHWHQLGNDRVTALAHNDGVIELVGQDRGATYYNWREPSLHNYAGGFGFVSAGGTTWCTAYAYRPPGAVTHRVFGVGYVEYVTEYAGVRVTRRTYAPPGDRAVLVSDVSIENLGTSPQPVSYYEYWDLNRHQLAFELLRSGSFAHIGDQQRDALNAHFSESVGWDAASATLRATMAWTSSSTQTPVDQVSPTDDHPNDTFLATLVGDVRDTYTDQDAFFGAGGPTRPDAVASPRAGERITAQSAMGQAGALIARSDVMVNPGQPVALRYAYGYAPPGAALDLPPEWRDPATDVMGQTLDWWRGRLAYFASETDPVLHREAAWHSYYLQSAAARPDYFQVHSVAQGSAYLYLHGFDGAPRDQSLFAMPLVYVNPDLARDLLTFVMEMTRATDGGIAYSYHGYGVLEDAAIHAHPSDLDIYFLMALTEYLAATGDRAFLATHVPFYPRDAGAFPPSVAGDTVLDHARAAVCHLVDTVGNGSHGLVRVLDGDWNDGISVLLGVDGRTNTIASGESHANTAMAAYVFPRAADVLAAADPALAGEMRSRAAAWSSALAGEWTGRWYPRAWLRDAANQPVLIGGDSGALWLESQPWALLSNAPTPAQRASLLAEIDMRVDSPSPIGAMIQEPVPGNEASAQVWPAVGGILTWAYAHDRADLAWRSVLRQTYAAHAETYPNIWYGIWSGPDGIEGARATDAGYTWSSVATPMTDFPVMNVNPDAMALLGIVRVAGIEPRADGLAVHPTVPGGAWALDTALLEIRASAASYAGEYRAVADGSVVLHLALPAAGTVTSAHVSGSSVTPVVDADGAALPLSFHRGDRVAFDVGYQ